MEMEPIIKTKLDTTQKIKLQHYLLEECFAMTKHLSAYGKEIPMLASSILNFNMKDCSNIDITEKEVLKLHKELSKKIAPASPKTVWLLYKESQSGKKLSFLGPVKLIRRLMLVALVSLILFILISCSTEINALNISEGIYKLNGLSLFIVLSFYLVSASLGATFSSLFKANRYIINNTYDPKFEASYWILYVLGVIAGIMLAVIIPIPNESANESLQMAVASRPMLAMLGGFSAALVYRILFRMVFAVESLFVGKQEDQLDSKIAGIQSVNEMEKENEKQKFINQLLSLQGQLTNGKTSTEINDEIQKKINEITG
jgi:hypothetical protein